MPSGRIPRRRASYRRATGLRGKLAAALVAMGLAGCQGPGYLQNGIGSQLAASDIANATTLQNQYFDHLCRQAGFPAPCNLPTFDEGMWTMIVRQGMNDIDRRCDAYLEWLDDKKRTRGPLLSQVGDVQTAATSIISLVDPGSAAALQVVAIAFNLISKSIENYHSRLLLEIETSTVNSIVLRARHNFRKETASLRFNSRPDAEYALRSYLRLCLPFSIETNINDYSTLGSLGIEPSERNTINQMPILGARLREDTPETVFEPVRPSKPEPPPRQGPGEDDATDFRGRIEQGFSRPGVRELQARLCVPQTGRFDARTRAAITIAEQETESSRINGIIDTNVEEDIIRAETPGCDSLATGARNTFEKFRYRTDKTQAAADKIKRFQTGLLVCVERVEQINGRAFAEKPATGFASGTLDSTTRAAIRFLAPDLVADDKQQAMESGLLSAPVVQAAQNCVFNPRSG